MFFNTLNAYQTKKSFRYGKIKGCMLNAEEDKKSTPPRLIPSLVEGFNAIAIFPVLVDLVLWFGPMLRIKELLYPAIMRAVELSAAAYGEEGQLFRESSQRLWSMYLEGFNLLSGIRTYPIGVPSLMISQGVTSNPLGNLAIFEMNSANAALMLILSISLVGIALGSVYYALIASAACLDGKRPSLGLLVKQASQSTLLAFLLFLAMLVLGLPILCLFSSILLILPSLGIFPVTILGMLLLWILLPLAFAPHGIFTEQLNAAHSIVISVKLVRNLMSVTGLFFILVLFISYGMDYLWSTPAPNSWMMLIGIIGHAFVTSGLIAATFIFYRNGLSWLKSGSSPRPINARNNL